MESVCDVHGDPSNTSSLNSSSIHEQIPRDCTLDGLCDMCQTLAKLDAEISDLEARMIEASQERRDLKITINRHHDRLIHRFPLEITCKIFNQFVEDEGPRYQKYNLRNPVLILGAVCKRWREFTLNMPELWSKVTLDLWRYDSLERLKMLEKWVGRSGSAPLFLKIKSWGRPASWEYQDQKQALERLLPFLRSQSTRWGGLSFAGSPQLTRVLLNGLGAAPQLDFLNFTIRTEGPTHSYLSQLSMEGEFNPKSLSVVTHSLLGVIPLRWKRLTQLEAGAIAVNELLYIVQAATNLRMLRMDNITRANNRSEFPMPSNPIVHNSLTHLDTENSGYAGVLRHLTLPALQNLKHGVYNTSLDYNLFPRFITRSGGLKFLTHFSFAYRVDDLNNQHADGDWYGKIPSVTHLHISIPPVAGKPGEDRLRIGERLLSPLIAQRQPLTFPLLREFSITPLLSTTSWSYIADMFSPTSIDDNFPTTTPGATQEQPARLIERVSVELSADESFHEPDVMISESDLIRFAEIQELGVRIELTIDDYGRKPLEWLTPRGQEMKSADYIYCDLSLDSSSDFE